MERSRLFAVAAVAVIVGVPVVSGPAFGLVDFTTRPTEGLGQGSATVDEVEAPDTARFDRALSSDSYVLEVPDARVHVAAIEGRPLVSYKIAIEAMGYSRGTTHFLDSDDGGWLTLSMRSDTFAPDRIDQSRYDAELSLILRVNDTEQTLYRGPVTVEVTR